MTQKPDWPTDDEADSDYDGFGSTHAEWHALVHGLYTGFTTAPWRTPPTPAREDVRKELHYYRGGYLLGSLLQVLVLAGMGREAVEAGYGDAVVRALLGA